MSFLLNRRGWWIAIRPKTLPAAASAVITGTALAWWDGSFKPLPAMAALVCALLLQIGSNLANDVHDFERGTDTGGRRGPTPAGPSRRELTRLLLTILLLMHIIVYPSRKVALMLLQTQEWLLLPPPQPINERERRLLLQTEVIFDTLGFCQGVRRISGGADPLLPLDVLQAATASCAPGVFIDLQQRVFQRLGFGAFLPVKV